MQSLEHQCSSTRKENNLKDSTMESMDPNDLEAEGPQWVIPD